jgi:preprotein translocase subunit SecE
VAKDTPAESGEPEVSGLSAAEPVSSEEPTADEVTAEPSAAADQPATEPAADPASPVEDLEDEAIAGYFPADGPAPAAAPVVAEPADDKVGQIPADDNPSANAGQDSTGDLPGSDRPDPASFTLVLDEELEAGDATEAEAANGTDDGDAATNGDDDLKDGADEAELAAEAELAEAEVEPDEAETDETEPDELAGADVAVGAKSSRPVKRSAASPQTAPPATPRAAAARKNRPTRTRTDATAVHETERTTPAKFVGQSVQELKKVVWPTGPQLRQFFIVVLAFVLFLIAFVSLLDLGIGTLILKLFGQG